MAAARIGGVGAECQPQPTGPTAGKTHDATAEHEVARRVMTDRDVVPRQEFALPVIEPHAVCTGQAALQKALPMHLRHQTAAPAPVERSLRPCFQEMRVNGDVMPVAQCTPELPGLRRTALRRIRPQLHAHPARSTPRRRHQHAEIACIRLRIQGRRGH